MNNKNRVYAILFLALCSLSAQTYTMSRFFLGVIVGGTLNEARNVGKNIVETPTKKTFQAIADAAENTIGNVLVPNTPRPKEDFIAWAKRECNYIAVGTPVVISDMLNKAQELIAPTKEKSK